MSKRSTTILAAVRWEGASGENIQDLVPQRSRDLKLKDPEHLSGAPLTVGLYWILLVNYCKGLRICNNYNIITITIYATITYVKYIFCILFILSVDFKIMSY